MKVLSCIQPWGNLIAWKIKIIETRKWYTWYRGDLLIVASKTLDLYAATDIRKYLEAREIIKTESDLLSNRGQALCLVELYDCKPMTKQDEQAACCRVYDKAHSFFLRNIRPVYPFYVRGQLNIFPIDMEIEELQFIESK